MTENTPEKSIKNQVLIWAAVIIAVTVGIAVIFGTKAASYAGGGLIVAAIFRIREMKSEQEDKK